MISDTYSSIGPFRGVPADVLADCARRFNATQEASIVALSRHARALSDTPGHEAAIRPSISVLNSAWKTVGTDAASSLKSAKDDVRGSFLIPVLFWIPSMLMLYSVFRNAAHGPFFPMIWVTLVFMLFLALNWAVVGRCGLAAIREIRKQGFLGDALPVALETLAGKSLLVGTKGLHCADRDEAGKITVKTIYWDAVGHALSEVNDDGIEVVTVHGRDGSVLASVSGPTGFRDAQGLVELVAHKVDAARKGP